MRDSLTVCSLAVALAVLFASDSVGSDARQDSVLAWDDGDYDTIYDSIMCVPGEMLAVRFQAPPWAESAVGVSFYIMEHTGSWPSGGVPDTACAFLARVWKPDADQPSIPGLPAYSPVNSGGGQPVDAWLHLTLPEPVDIADPVAFPDRVFFVGLEWLDRASPQIGVDLDQPLYHMTWRFNWADWAPIDDSDAMIRAVVSDEPGTPVESESWSRVKAMFG